MLSNFLIFFFFHNPGDENTSFFNLYFAIAMNHMISLRIYSLQMKLDYY